MRRRDVETATVRAPDLDRLMRAAGAASGVPIKHHIDREAEAWPGKRSLAACAGLPRACRGHAAPFDAGRSIAGSGSSPSAEAFAGRARRSKKGARCGAPLVAGNGAAPSVAEPVPHLAHRERRVKGAILDIGEADA